MFVTYQPARVIRSEEITLKANEEKFIGDEGLSTRASFPEGAVVCGISQGDKTKGYVTSDGEIFEFSGEICVYNPKSADMTLYTVTSDTF